MLGLVLTICLEAVGLLIAVAIVIYLLKRLRIEHKSVRFLLSEKSNLYKDIARQEAQIEQEAGEKERYELLFAHTENMVFVYGVAAEQLPGAFKDVNQPACSLLSYSREDLHGMTLMDIEVTGIPSATTGYSRSDLVVLSDEYVQERQARIASSLARRRVRRILDDGEARYETTYSTREGHKIPVEVVERRFEIAGEPMIICTAQSIEERKKAKQELDDSRRRFQDFFANSPMGIVMYDAGKSLVDVNPACLKIFGVPDRQAFEGVDLFGAKFVPEESRKELALGRNVRYEAALDFDDVQHYAKFVTTRSGKAYLDLLINRMGHGQDFEPSGYFAQVRDITEQRLAEAGLQKREQQLRQAEKMEAVGTMAGGIAHDFNNILTPIIGYTKMLLRLLPESEKSHQYASEIYRVSGRAKKLVGQILTFSRKTDENDKDLRAIHLLPIVNEVLALQRSVLPVDIEITKIIKTEHDGIKADPVKLHQVLMNLCTNAGHAMETNGGVLELSVMEVVADAKKTQGTLASGRYLRLSIRDTGMGMDPDTVSRIFEPFFTTKKSSGGTGLGLAVVHGIIRSFKGMISVDTEEGKGSVFHVLLPLVDVDVADKEMNQRLP